MQPVVISLSTWIKFLVAEPAGRLTRVAATKERYEEDYSPGLDFWRRLHTAFVLGLRLGDVPTAVNTALSRVSDPRRVAAYRRAAEALVKWLDENDVEYVGPCSRSSWTDGRLKVRVVPDALLRVNGRLYAVKLFLDSTKPVEVGRIAPALELLRRAAAPDSAEARPAVLDVIRGEFHSRMRVRRIDALLAGEAAAFIGMWNGLSDAA